MLFPSVCLLGNFLSPWHVHGSSFLMNTSMKKSCLNGTCLILMAIILSPKKTVSHCTDLLPKGTSAKKTDAYWSSFNCQMNRPFYKSKNTQNQTAKQTKTGTRAHYITIPVLNTCDLNLPTATNYAIFSTVHEFIIRTNRFGGLNRDSTEP